MAAIGSISGRWSGKETALFPDQSLLNLVPRAFPLSGHFSGMPEGAAEIEWKCNQMATSEIRE